MRRRSRGLVWWTLSREGRGGVFFDPRLCPSRLAFVVPPHTRSSSIGLVSRQSTTVSTVARMTLGEFFAGLESQQR